MTALADFALEPVASQKLPNGYSFRVVSSMLDKSLGFNADLGHDLQ